MTNFIVKNGIAGTTGSFSGALTAAGATLSSAVNFGSTVASSLNDVSRHVNLWGGSYGFNVTGSDLNVVSGGVVSFVTGAGSIAKLIIDNSGNIYSAGSGTFTGSITASSYNGLTSGNVTTALGFTPANGSNYLALAGGTLTGWLNGTAAGFSSNVTANGLGAKSPGFASIWAQNITAGTDSKIVDFCSDGSGNAEFRLVNDAYTASNTFLGVGRSGYAISFMTLTAPTITLAGALAGTTGSFSGAVTAAALSGTTGTFSGNLTFAGALTGTGATQGFEFGSTSVANQPYIDWHSSGNNIDYDARILASGGSATVGQGSINYYAGGGHVFTGPITSTGSGSFSGAVTAATFTGAFSGTVTASSGTFNGTVTINDPSTADINSLTVSSPSNGNGVSIKLVGNGGTTPNKYIRVINGGFEIVNSIYSATILHLSDGGNLISYGGIDSTAIGANTPSSGAFTSLSATGLTVSAPSLGFINVNLGSTVNTGYIGFFNAAGVRQGYLGYGAAGSPLVLQTEGSTTGWQTNGNFTIGGALTGTSGSFSGTVTANGVTANGVTANGLGAKNPGFASISVQNTTAGTDSKIVDFCSGGSGDAEFRLVNDAYTASNAFLQVGRSGYAISSMTLTAPTITLAGALAGTTASFTGTLTAPTVNIDGGTIDNTAIGATTPSTGAFTSLSANAGLTISNGVWNPGVIYSDGNWGMLIRGRTTGTSYADLGLANGVGSLVLQIMGSGIVNITNGLSVAAGLTVTTGGAAITGTVTATRVQELKTAMAAANLDLNTGAVFTKTISGATTLTVSNVPASGTVGSFILELTNGGSATITWWAGIKWASGAGAPALTASGIDDLGFFTFDGGATWRGLVLGKAMA